MNDVDNNLHYKKHMLNLLAILNHEEERATFLAELWFKERRWTAVTGTGILCLIIAETIISAVTGLLVTCLCNNSCLRRASLLCQLILDVKKAKVI